MGDSQPLACETCSGTGSLHRRTCPDCSGRGDVSCHLCPHHEPATRMAQCGDPVCAECGLESDRDYAGYIYAELTIGRRVSDDDRAWLAANDDRLQEYSERIACGDEAWSGGFAENN